MRSYSMRHSWTVWALVVVGAAGCGGEDETAAGPCPFQVAGECVGVPDQPVCDADYCTGGADCAQVVQVASQPELSAAAAGAAAGTCIALAPGRYDAVDLPGGVSLLGKGAGVVTLSSVSLGQGSGALLRGVHVEGGGVHLTGVQAGRIESVRVSASAQSGIDLADGSSVVMVTSEVLTSADYGIRGLGATGLTVERSVLADGEGPGLWVQCAEGCACATRPTVSLDRVLVARNAHVGVSLAGVQATLTQVDVLDTGQRGLTAGGGGLSVSACSELVVSDLRVEDAASFGVLVDGSSADFGTPGGEQGIIIVNTRVGMWLSNIATGADPAQTVEVHGAELAGNAGVGLGIDGGAQGIIIVNTRVADTWQTTLPVAEGGSSNVGDGLVWTGRAQVQIQGLTLSGNERLSMLIDGEVGAGSSLSEVTQIGGDEAKGIVHQQLPQGGTAPTVDDTVPTIASDVGRLHAVASAPQAPTAL